MKLFDSVCKVGGSTMKYIETLQNKMTNPVVYRELHTVLNFLNSYRHDNLEAVNALLQAYNNAETAFKEKDSSWTKKHPFIVLEGLDGCGKSTITRKLSSKLNAAKWCTPPESIKHIRHLFDDHPHLRNAYYALGNYIAALECDVILQKQPVVMDRYWHSTSAYAVAQAAHDFPDKVEIPPEGDSFYQWPDDLLKPDVVLFLDVSENVRNQRLSRRQSSTNQEGLLKQSQQFRRNIILAYKNMVNPNVIFVNSNLYVNKVLLEINDKIKHLFVE